MIMINKSYMNSYWGSLVQVGNDIELDIVGCQFEIYWWTVVVPLWCDLGCS